MTLKELRVGAAKSQRETARYLNISVSSLSHCEAGRRNINIHQIIPLAKFYDCTAEDVILAQLNTIPHYS